MTVETASLISDLNPLLPDQADGVSEGDNHLRLLKSVIKTTLPNINAIITATDEHLNSPAFQKIAELTPAANTVPRFTGASSADLVTIGTGANNLVQLDANGALPAVPGAVPAGTVLPFAGNTEPSGYLLCYGQAVSRTTYASLFTTISTTYGSGDGSTTFNLPDLRGRVAAGKDNMGGSAASRLTSAGMTPDGATLGATGGQERVTLQASHLPDNTLTAFSQGTGGSINRAIGSHTGSGVPHDNTQPTIVLNYIIKT